MTWTICNNKHSFLATRNTPSLNPSKYPSLFNFSSTILYHWPYVLIIGHSFSPAKCVFSLNTWATVITLSTTESCSTSSYTSIIPNLTDLVNWLNSFSFYLSFFLSFCPNSFIDFPRSSANSEVWSFSRRRDSGKYFLWEPLGKTVALRRYFSAELRERLILFGISGVSAETQWIQINSTI